MELLYLWINDLDGKEIKKQELNFSPVHHFSVDDKTNPGKLCYYKESNGLNIMQNGHISNITALVGSNGAGKTSVLSFIANNNCYPKFNWDENYSQLDKLWYERTKSIYVFLNDDGEFILYHDLENEIVWPDVIKKENVYHNRGENPEIPMLCDIRRQMIVYLSNSSFVPNGLKQYSQSRGSYNINLHLQSLNLVAERFYKSLWNINELNDNTDGFASAVIKHRNAESFQELLDIMYYHYLLSYNIKDFAGKLKDEIYVFLENIIALLDTEYLKDIEKIKYKKSYAYELDGSPEIKLSSSQSEKYYSKREEFFAEYDAKELEILRRSNPISVLYFNLLFEAYYYDEGFAFPKLSLYDDIYSQLAEVFKQNKKYLTYLNDIKEADEIFSEYKNYENIIGNPDDLACRYEKVINKDSQKFYSYFSDMFSQRKSYVLRFIRIKNLEMSSDERAMQNMFSWLTLIPELDKIMSIKRESYTSKLLLIDEIDLYSHPEWQRMIISQMIDTINKTENMPVQIILTSHSPIILSDFPKQNVVYLRKYDNHSGIENGSEHKSTFGANIYTLFNDAFFLKKGAVGEYAKNLIYQIYMELKDEEHKNDDKKEYYQNFIELIGNEILKNEMRKAYKRRFGDRYYD